MKGTLASLALPLVWTQLCSAQGESDVCTDALDIKLSEDAVGLVGLLETQVFFWLQGSQTTGRGSIALFIALPQKTDDFVDRVVLADEGKESLGVRYFSSKERTVQGYPPYVLFENVPLYSGKYFVLVRKVKAGQAKVYRHTFDPLRFDQSALDSPFFPKSLREDLLPFQGKVSNFFQKAKSLFQAGSCREEYKTLDTCFQEHHVRASLKRPAKGKGFQVEVDFLHPDYDAKHYMRNFILTDPVGRLLAWKHRTFQAQPRGKVVLAPIQSSEIAKLRIPNFFVAALEDCPYVMLFAEDGKHAISHQLIGLH